MKQAMQVQRVDAVGDPALDELIRQSDEYLASLYPPESNHTEPLAALISDTSAFFKGVIGSECVACGAVKLMDDDIRYGEIKRVFVSERQRGSGLATAIMSALEDYILEHDISVARLEAGPLQPAALKLYGKLGYRERGPFGSYQSDPLSTFMEKHLSL